MKSLKIKAEWASINLNQDNSVTLCVKKNGSTQCIRFDSLDELKQGLYKKWIIVKKWALAIPRSMCFLKTLSFPASNLEEALSMIEYELPSVIPLSMDEIVYGTTFLNQREQMLDVLICIVKQSILNDYINPLRAIGIEPRKIYFSSLAMQNWINIKTQTTKEPVIGVAVNDHSCIIQTSIQGNYQNETELEFGKHTKTELINDILHEIRHQRQNLDASIREKINYLLIGNDEYVSEIKSLLSSIEHESTSDDRITILQSPELICSANESKDGSDKFDFDTIIASGLLDLAVNSKLNYSNLISRHSAKNLRQTALKSKYVTTGLFCMAFILFLWLYLFASNWRIEKMSGMIQAQIDPIKDIAKTVEKKRQQVRAVQGQFKQRGRLTEIIKELYKYTPSTISISKMNYVSKHNKSYIDIKGQADLLFTPFDYTENISEAKMLSGMQIRDTQQIPQANGSIVIFKAYCEIGSE